MLSSLVFSWLMQQAAVHMGMPGMIAPSVVVGIYVMFDGQSGFIMGILLVGLRIRPTSLRRGVIKATVSSIREASIT